MELCDNLPVGNQIFAMMEEEAKRDGIPLSGTFELTPRCNFDCKMCYVHLKDDRIPCFGRELTAAEWISLAEQARDLGMLHLCITGGEPTLHPQFFEIYEALAQMGFFITLQTNASTMSPRLRALLEEYPPQMVKLTIYGSSDAVYEDVCGIRNGFSRVDAGIRTLQDLHIPILAVTTIIRQNLADVPRIAAYCQSMHLPWIYTATVQPSVRGAETDAEAVALDETMTTDFRADVREMVEHPVMRDEKKPCDYCKGYRDSFWVMWNGNLQFCSFMNEPKLSVRGQPFAEVWQKLLAYEEALRWPKECQVCEIRQYCRRCAGAIAARSGSAETIDPAFCAKMKRYIKEELEREKA